MAALIVINDCPHLLANFSVKANKMKKLATTTYDIGLTSGNIMRRPKNFVQTPTANEINPISINKFGKIFIYITSFFLG